MTRRRPVPTVDIPDDLTELRALPPSGPVRDALCDEIERLRTEVARLRSRNDETYGGVLLAKAQRDELQARLDAAHALLLRWSVGLVPVGDYTLRAETDVAIEGTVP